MQALKAAFVGQRNSGNIHRRLAFFLQPRVYHLQCPVDDGQCSQAQKVKLDQAGVFHIILIKLGNRMLALIVTVNRRKIGDGGWRNDDPTGMFTGVTGNSFKLACHINDGAHFFVGVVQFRQPRLFFKGFFQGHPRITGDQFRNTVNKAVRMAHHPAHIPHHSLGGHGAEGDDLRHRIAAIKLGNVINDLIPFVHAKVDVKVGHRHPFRVQKALEQQIKFQRVKIGDFQRVGYQRTGPGAPPRANRDIVVFGPLDKLGDDQKVAGKTHLVYHPQLDAQALVIRATFAGPLGFIREQEC